MNASVTWAWRALRRDGAEERGTVAATERDEVVRLLASRGLLATGISRRNLGSAPSATMTWADLAVGLRLLANLLAAGLTVNRALTALADTAPAAWTRDLPRIREAVSEGQSLAGAMRTSHSGVPDAVIGLLQAGEAGEGLAAAAARAASLAESAAATRAAVRQALVYPIILLIAGCLSLGFLVAVVLPRFAVILQDLGQDLPPATRLVLAGAEFARAIGPVVLAAAILLLAWFPAWVRRPGNRLRWHRMLRSVPVAGAARRSLATARACDAAGALLETGVRLPLALRLGADACGDTATASGIELVRSSVAEGAALSVAAQRHGVFTSTAVRLIRAGEETGRLGPMLREAGRLEQLRAEQLLRNAMQFIEPAFILGLGALVALVAAALLQALYGMRPV